MFSVENLKNKIVNFFPIEIQKKLIAASIVLGSFLSCLLFCPAQYYNSFSNILFAIVYICFVVHIFLYIYSSTDKISKKIAKSIFGLVWVSFWFFAIYALCFYDFSMQTNQFELVLIDAKVILEWFFFALFYCFYDIFSYYIQLDEKRFFSKTKMIFLASSLSLSIFRLIVDYLFNGRIANLMQSYLDKYSFLFLASYLIVFVGLSIIIWFILKAVNKLISFYRNFFNMKKNSVFNAFIDFFNVVIFSQFCAIVLMLFLVLVVLLVFIVVHFLANFFKFLADFFKSINI